MPNTTVPLREHYARMRELAHRELSRRPKERSLQTTDLAHEAILRTRTEAEGLQLEEELSFLVRSIRDILVERARSRTTLRRDGGKRVDLQDQDVPEELAPLEDVLAVHEVLEQLRQQDPRAARVVELRFLSGLSEAEVASLLGITDRTVRRDWTFARAWLAERLVG